MKIDAWLLDILACPNCRGPLRPDEEDLACAGECGKIYPVTAEGVPVLLVDEARAPKA
ncbi:Trm112 family protein [Actinocorallia aurantiaca]|uniref:Trm112 family protein n=1 Tax=Actinocorallia aurantiaca TaxID=46204 RepID=A0ABN3UIM1_9ACTN